MPAVSVRLFDQESFPWYVVVTTTGILVAQTARPPGEVFFAGEARYWFVVYSLDATPWYVSPSPMGGSLLTQQSQPAIGPGSVNTIPFRDAASVLWHVLVSNTGVLYVSEDAEALFPDQDLFYCFKHGLVYRPDVRIYPLSTTHCPVDNSPLVSWRDVVSGREGEYDYGASEISDQWYG